MKIFNIALTLFFATSVSYAAEHEHEGHGVGAVSVMAPAPVQVNVAPPSGKARESGYDGNDMMESTGVENIASVQCAQAARGIIILDRADLARCSPAAAEKATPEASPPAAPLGEHQHHH